MELGELGGRTGGVEDQAHSMTAVRVSDDTTDDQAVRTALIGGTRSSLRSKISTWESASQSADAANTTGVEAAVTGASTLSTISIRLSAVRVKRVVETTSYRSVMFQVIQAKFVQSGHVIVQHIEDLPPLLAGDHQPQIAQHPHLMRER